MDGKHTDETVQFQRIRTIEGKVEPIDLVRRNRQLVPRFDISLLSGIGENDRQSDLLPLYRELMYGLTRLERRTWVPLLLGRSFDEVAKLHGVSRQALYARIRGNSKGQGGMIRKNDYVAIWWRTQRHQILIKRKCSNSK